MQTTKLSDFLKQQGDTPQGKSVYQAFIDNFDKYYYAESFRTYEKNLIINAFQWDICPEDYTFWEIISAKWQKVTDPENDMLWLIDGKDGRAGLKPVLVEPDIETYNIDPSKIEAVTPTEQTPILPIGTNQLLDTKETKELDEAAKAIDPFGYYENGGDHYAKHTIQPWDIIREYELDYFEGNALKYLLRQKDNRLEDLQKAAHYLEECIKNEQKRIENE
jgi:hypothetical protein